MKFQLTIAICLAIFSLLTFCKPSQAASTERQDVCFEAAMVSINNFNLREKNMKISFKSDKNPTKTAVYQLAAEYGHQKAVSPNDAIQTFYNACMDETFFKINLK